MEKIPLSAEAKWTTMGESCEVIMGQSPKSEFYNTARDGLPFFQGKKEFGETHPVAEKWCNAPLKIAQKGDVLISVRAPVGPVNIADMECCIGRGLAILRPKKEMTTKWLFWYLKSAEQVIGAMGTGSTFTAISGGILWQFPIPLPPMAVQREIVARIESQFARLASVSDYVKNTRNKLQQTRATIWNHFTENAEGKIALQDFANVLRPRAAPAKFPHLRYVVWNTSCHIP